MIESEAYARARLAASEYRMADSVAQKLSQQFGAWERYDMTIPPAMQEWVNSQYVALDAMKAASLRAVVREWKDTPVGQFVTGTVGVGPVCLIVLSLAPELSRFANPAKLWKYLGLHAARTTDRTYNAQLKAWCIFRVAEPCMKNRASPYRAVYDKRRSSRPDMLPAGECSFCDEAYAKRKATKKQGWDCHNMGGPHYKPSHANIDALGVTAKAILLDAWRVAHGMNPKHGSVEDVDA